MLTVRICSALSISLAAHLLLICWAGMQGGGEHPVTRGAGDSRPALDIRLVDSRKPSAAPADLKTAGIQGADAAKSQAPAQSRSPRDSVPGERSIPLPPLDRQLVDSSAARYFRQDDLTEKTGGSLDVPIELAIQLADEVQKAATLRLQINEAGTVDRVIVMQSTFPEAQLAQLVETFKLRKFTAGRIQGEPVKSELDFDLSIAKPRRAASSNY